MRMYSHLNYKFETENRIIWDMTRCDEHDVHVKFLIKKKKAKCQ